MLLKTLLFPFSIIYGWIVGIRNMMYDKGLKPSASFELPVIGVGNITVGGTGKTPMVEYLVRLLSPGYRVATLSRGYGRATKGYRQASEIDSARTIGDEPFQYYRKFGAHVPVAVGEERALAIPNLLQDNGDVQVVVLDDAFQHRRVQPSLNILLCDVTRPFYEDLVLPAGRLRESKHGASRADVIVVTKCQPGMSNDEQLAIEKNLRNIAIKPIFFTSISYGGLVPFGPHDGGAVGSDVVLVTAIANPTPFSDYMATKYRIIRHFNYSDHHAFSGEDVDRILAETEKNPAAVVVTTEKDMVKLDQPEFYPRLKKVAFFYVPITVQFLHDADAFDQIILDHVKNRV